MTRSSMLPLPPLLLLALLAAAPAPAAAQGWIEPGPDGAVERVRTAVRASVEGRVARVEVEEWFVNRGHGLAEGHYLYPLPGEAVFSDVSLFQGDQELRGETMDAERARAIYEEIVRQRRDPALIELAGRGLLRARVFPIGPGETRRITLRYTQVLERSGDALQFRYLAGRAGPARWGGPVPVQPMPMPRRDLPRERPAAAAPTRAPLSFVLTADDGAAFLDPFSPTHDVRVTRDGGRLTVRPTGELSGDVALFLPLARGRVGMTLVTHRTPGEDGWFMLTLSPGATRAAVLPRDVVAVVDVSGSMQGEKMEQTREALRALLSTLRPTDRFRLVAFSSRVMPYREGWTSASPAELAQARAWVDALQAAGGTAIADALAEAFRLDAPEGRLPVVLFLTDGLPTVGERDPEAIAAAAEQARGRARVFAFGVGYDVNTLLLDRLSEAGRGSTAYVRPDESVETAVGALAAKVSAPVLTDIEIDGAPVRLTEVYPERLPDLFVGEELVVVGRWEGQGRGALRLTGRRGRETERFTLDASFPARAAGADYLPRLWAARKIGVLERAVRLNGADPELVEEIRALALRYGVLTAYTAHLVQEPEMMVAGGAGVRMGPPGAGAAADRGMPRPAAPLVGEVAVKAAESARRRREAVSLQAIAIEESAMAADADAGTRMLAGRVFRLEGEAWVEVGAGADGRRVVEVQAFGPDWMELARRLPELAPVLSELERVTVRGAKVDLRVVERAPKLSPAALTRLVAELRGT
ncbi:MAG TPA: VIT domain-containing protein [Longimicrobiales bacterium]|nr:VIT domain-containing protein [Longimicrobiales bacterium]